MKNKKSDLSIYDKPFDIDNFVFATPTTIRKIRISRDGFTPIIAQLKSDGIWYGLGHKYRNGDERWFKYNEGVVENFISNLPETDTLEELP